MKRKKKATVRRTIRVVMLIITLVFGLVGYGVYYFNNSDITLPLSQTIYSTIRLFGASFDFNYQLPNNVTHPGIIIAMLEVARWFAIFLTGHVVFKLLQPFFSGIVFAQRAARWNKKNQKVFIIGNNEHSRMIYRSLAKEDNGAVLASSLDECEQLAKQNIHAVTAKGLATEDTAIWAQGAAKKAEQVLFNAIDTHGKCTLVINTDNDQINMELAKRLVEFLKKNLFHKDVENIKTLNEELHILEKQLKDCTTEQSAQVEQQLSEKREQLLFKKKMIVEAFQRIRIYVFGDRNYSSIYQHLQDYSNGLLHFVNKDQLVAFDFISRYSFPDCMDDKMFQMHVHNACLSEQLQLNMVLLGFGQTNREIFTASFANNQFICGQEGSLPQLKKVNYYIFDKQESNLHDKVLSDDLYRYQEEFLDAIREGEHREEEYFGVFDFPANIESCHVDVFDKTFFKKIRQIHQKDDSTITQVVICLGDDLQNLDLAHRLAKKRLAWGINNLHIYAGAQNSAAVQISQAQSQKQFSVFGDEEKLVYNYRAFGMNHIEQLAVERNAMYALEFAHKTGNKISRQEVLLQTDFNWFAEMDSTMRLSNMMSILSLRGKLQLMGLDCLPRAESTEAAGKLLSNEAYLEQYVGEQKELISQLAKGEMCNTFLPKESYLHHCVRNNLAIQEHYRWNAFMIACGFVPQDIKTTLSVNTKDYLRKKHSNISTFEGLFVFREMLAQQTGTDERKQDVIRYDYQIMDDVWRFLNTIGFSLYQKRGFGGDER